jgi:putative spermidine/putrescine transport system permease protein
VSSDPLRAVPGRAGGHDGSWRRRWAARLLAVLAAAPLVVLPVRALAETWRAPSLLPQTWSTRGFAVLGASGTHAGEAVTNSLVVALGTVLVALLLGWPAARSLAAAPRGRRLVATVVLALPLLVSPFATGVGLTEWFIRIGLTDTIVGLVLAHLVYVLPYVVLLLAPAFSHGVDDLEEAAAVLGAPPARRLALVVAPAVAPALGAALLLGFLVSWSQYGTSLAVGAGIPMLPLVLLPFVGRDPQVAAALSLVFLVPALAALAASVRRPGEPGADPTGRPGPGAPSTDPRG